jgi:hypothetical protein
MRRSSLKQWTRVLPRAIKGGRASEVCINMRLLCMNMRLLCMNMRLLCINMRLLCMNMRLLCMNMRLLYVYVHIYQSETVDLCFPQGGKKEEGE